MPHPASVQESVSQLSSCDAVIALDYDAVAIATAAGSRCVAVTDDAETIALAAELGSQSLSPAAGGAALASAVQSALAGPLPGTGPARLLKARAEESVRMLRVLLSRGRDASAPDPELVALGPEPWAS